MVESLPPLEAHRLEVLVLGTMPGVRSLQLQQYYAHPRNAFWPMALARCWRRPPDATAAFALPYTQRVQRLTREGIGVWDVLARCDRPGSLDSAIVRGTEVPNDIAAVARRHPELRRVVLNGKTAERLFRRHILAEACSRQLFDAIDVRCLPSTSPAMASLTLAAKFRHWRVALE